MANFTIITTTTVTIVEGTAADGQPLVRQSKTFTSQAEQGCNRLYLASGVADLLDAQASKHLRELEAEHGIDPVRGAMQVNIG